MYGNPYYAPYQYPYYAQNADYKPQINQQVQTIPQQQQMAQNVPTAPQNDMVWVLNENEADAYPVAPNRTVTLWDKSQQTIYLKSMSANGIPSKRILDFTERTETPLKSSVTQENSLEGKFVTVEEFNDLKGDFDDLKAMYNKLSRQDNTKTETKPKVTAKKNQSEEE